MLCNSNYLPDVNPFSINVITPLPDCYFSLDANGWTLVIPIRELDDPPDYSE
jgi:hypothetical protein